MRFLRSLHTCQHRRRRRRLKRMCSPIRTVIFDIGPQEVHGVVVKTNGERVIVVTRECATAQQWLSAGKKQAFFCFFIRRKSSRPRLPVKNTHMRARLSSLSHTPFRRCVIVIHTNATNVAAAATNTLLLLPLLLLLLLLLFPTRQQRSYTTEAGVKNTNKLLCVKFRASFYRLNTYLHSFPPSHIHRFFFLTVYYVLRESQCCNSIFPFIIHVSCAR